MPFLSEAQRDCALRLARAAASAAAAGQADSGPIHLDGVFAQQHGVFVTLHVGSRLQGCIGQIEPAEPLGQAIASCARSAAVDDPRFRPLRASELPQLRIEISVLSRLEPILPEAVEIGRHGLLVRLGPKRGLLLPQVATEHHLGREEFLAATCEKAGLPGQAWRNPESILLGFTCEVFSEPERGI